MAQQNEFPNGFGGVPVAVSTADRAGQRNGNTVAHHNPKVNQGLQLRWKASELGGIKYLLRQVIIPFLGAGLFNGTIPEDGVLFNERRTGRKGRRQKSSAKFVNTNSQFVSSEKVNIDNGQARVKDGLNGDSSKLHLDFCWRPNLVHFMVPIN